MAAVLSIIGMIAGLVSFVCAIIVLIHAFQAELLQGILCLCVPFYILYYMFARFEHDQKPLILGGYFGGIIVNVICTVAAAAMSAPGAQ